MYDILQMIFREIRGAWRFRWWAMFTLWVVCLGGWMLVYKMPDVYEAQTRFFVDQKSRVDELVEGSVKAEDVAGQLNLVRQSMLGRPILEKVARETDLDHRAKSPREFQKLIENLRKEIKIVEADSRHGASDRIYQVTFRDYDRNMSQKVVQNLLDTFIEDVIKSGHSDADKAVVILREQIHKRETELRSREQALADFKRENVGLLPGESGSYFQRLQLEMQQLQTLDAQLSVARSRRATLMQQLNRENPVIEASGGGGPVVPGTELEQRIAELETTLNRLLLDYTDKHPIVVATREQLEQLKTRRDREIRELRDSGALEGVPLSNNPIYQQIQIALNTVNVEISSLESQQAERRRSVKLLRDKVDVIPQIEAKLEDLTRDYAQVKTIYDELRQTLERELLRIEIGDREEMVFSIIDPPAVAFEPVAPKRSLLLIAVLFFGFGAAGGLAYLMHLTKPVFTDTTELRDITGLPVLGSVRITWLERHQSERRMEASSLITAMVLLFGVFGVVLVFQDAGGSLLRSIVG